jgi:gliding motility-associated-like protein
MKKLSILLISVFVSSYSLIAQVGGGCSVDIIPAPVSDTVLCGDSVFLNADGNAVQTQLTETFNTSNLGPGWQGTTGISFNNPCGPGPNNSTDPHMWMGSGIAGNRAVTTVNFDLSCGGGFICFDLRFEQQGGSAPCEGPDQPDEGVYLQYSTNNGATWNNINYFNPDTNNSSGGASSPLVTWGNYCFPIPPGAQTPATQIRWFQINTSGSSFDHWGLDNVEIYTTCGTGYTYNWYSIDSASTPPSVNFQFQDSGNLSPLDTLLYDDLTYAVMFFNNLDTCYDTLAVNVLPNPIEADLSEPQICYQGDSAQVELSGGSIYTWNVLNGDPLNVGTNIGCATCDSTWLSPGNTTTYQVGSDLTGLCHQYDTITLETVTQFDAGFSFNDPVCVTADTISGTPIVSGGTFSGQGIIDPSGIFDPTLTAPGGNIPVTYSIPGVCGNDSTIDVEVIPLPDATVTTPDSLCYDGGPYTFQAATPGGVWTGNAITDSIAGTFDPNVISPGITTVLYELDQPCYNYDSVTVFLYEPYQFNLIDTPKTVCINDTLILDNYQRVISGNSAGPDPFYSWNGPGIVNPDSGFFDPSTLSPGRYTIDITAADSTGACGTTESMGVVIYPVDTPKVVNNLIYCDNNDRGNININTGFGQGNWSIIPISPTTTPLVPNQATGRFNPQDVGPGSWLLEYTYQNINGCIGELIDTIIIRNTPDKPQFDDTTYCVGDFLTIDGESDNPDSVLWYSSIPINSSNYLGSGMPFDYGQALQPTSENEVTIYARETNGECKSGLASYLLPIAQSPNSDFSRKFVDSNNIEQTVDKFAMIKGRSPFSITYDPVAPLDQYEFEWNLWLGCDPSQSGDGQFGCPIVNTEDPVVSFNYEKEGLYSARLIVTNEFGCSDTSFSDHEVLFSGSIPNVFTPNGDGVNDEFYIPGAGALRDFRVEIYNRWGRKVHEWTNPKEGWDGEGHSAGVYYYVVTAKRGNGDDYIEKGNITLIGPK